MLEQAFTNKSISKCIKITDITSKNYDSLDSIIEEALERVKKGFETDYISDTLTRNSKLVQQPNSLSDKILIRKISNNIRGVTSVKQQNRDLIISNLITLLQENFPYTIIQLDIKSFYESVDTHTLMNSIKKDTAISRKTITLLESLLSYYSSNRYPGLPRGLSISATLGEYVLKDFDKMNIWDKRFYFYSRFVDDIIILSTEYFEIKDLKKTFPLPMNLKFNGKKIYTCKLLKPNNKEALIEKQFSFLGYKFTVQNHKLNSSRIVKVAISDKKIRKIKTRLSRAFYSYSKNNNYQLLSDRIKLLTSNYSINKEDNNKTINVGIYYSNKHITVVDDLKQLDKYLKSLILSDGLNSIKKKLFLSTLQKRNLLKNTFSKGFKHKIFYNFSSTKLIKIKECWIND